MSINTSIFSRVYSSWSSPTKNVHFIGNQSKVAWITTRPIFTDMVNFFRLLVRPLLYFTVFPCIKKSVGSDLFPSKREPAVPLIDSTFPIPTLTIWIDEYLREYSFSFFFGKCKHVSIITEKLSYVQPFIPGWTEEDLKKL